MTESYVAKLQAWYDQEKALGRVIDIKFFPGIGEGGSIESTAKAIYETVTGIRHTEPINTKNL